jgi:hypothetical protein
LGIGEAELRARVRIIDEEVNHITIGCDDSVVVEWDRAKSRRVI